MGLKVNIKVFIRRAVSQSEGRASLFGVFNLLTSPCAPPTPHPLARPTIPFLRREYFSGRKQNTETEKSINRKVFVLRVNKKYP